mgnify:CR=1 FL=1
MGTDVHWHGISTPFDMDGVAPYTQDPIAPGETFTYAFLANAATFTIPALVLLGPLRHLHGRAARPAADEPDATASYGPSGTSR